MSISIAPIRQKKYNSQANVTFHYVQYWLNVVWYIS